MLNKLVKIGLSEIEARIYLAILDLGQSNVLEISNYSSVPRATIYLHLEKLIAEGLVDFSYAGKRRLYFASNPKRLLSRLEKEKSELDNLLPELLLKYRAYDNHPKIQVLENRRGVLKALDDVLEVSKRGSHYDVILSAKDEFKVLGDEFEKHVNKRVKKNISIRVIAERSPATRGWHRNQTTELREVRYLPKNEHINTTYHIYGDKVSIISLKWPFAGVIIDDKSIADMERLQFEYMWKGLRKKR